MNTAKPIVPIAARRAALLVAVIVAVLGWSLAVGSSRADGGAPDVVAQVIELVDDGHFRQAEAAIDAALDDDGLAPATAEALRFQRERMRRILIDFPYTEAEVRAEIGEAIPDLRDGELTAWEQSGALEHMVIDGEKRYFARSVSNLYRLSDQARERRATPPQFGSGPMETPNAHHRAVLEAARATGKTSVLPQRVRVTQSLTVDADAVPAGETVRAWIPFPRAIEGRQEDIALLSSEPAKHTVAPESALQRTVYMEKPAVAGQPTEFSISYELTVYARHFEIDPDKVVPFSTPAANASTPTSSFPRRRDKRSADRPKDDPEGERSESSSDFAFVEPKSLDSRLRGNDGEAFDPANHLGERWPHIVFTDDLRAFSEKVVGEETNPYRIAQKLFAAVDDIPWAGAREYSTISNISDYALHAGHADCGQQTLLLMTLLRLNGIPARWQSGMVYSAGDYDNLHDWGWLYLAPYGWVPMDVTTGRFEQFPELDWFYLGSLDAYRIAFNDDFGAPFHTPKQHFRSETVDSQRGEAEWRGGNLYFDQWDYAFEAQVLPEATLTEAADDTRNTD